MSELDPILEAVARKMAPLVAAELAPLLCPTRTEPPPAEDPILNAKQAGARLGWSDWKIRQLHKAGKLPSIPGSGTLRFRQSVVDALGTNPEKRTK